MTAAAVMAQNNGDVTRAFYDELSKRGVEGQIGVALFRAQKRSMRAKDYRRGKYRRSAYGVKEWSLGEVCRLLAAYGVALGFTWGWKQDVGVLFDGQPSWVLYVDIPGRGQVSFHNPTRGEGPDYAGEWDGLRGESAGRIIRFCDGVMKGAAVQTCPKCGTVYHPGEEDPACPVCHMANVIRQGRAADQEERSTL